MFIIETLSPRCADSEQRPGLRWAPHVPVPAVALPLEIPWKAIEIPWKLQRNQKQIPGIFRTIPSFWWFESVRILEILVNRNLLLLNPYILIASPCLMAGACRPSHGECLMLDGWGWDWYITSTFWVSQLSAYSYYSIEAVVYCLVLLQPPNKVSINQWSPYCVHGFYPLVN